jgi:predicted phosphodiesterase
MKRTILLGDTHGRDVWKYIVAQETDADRIVFIGDYFDSFDIPGVVQLQNFLDIIEFKKNSDKEVVLLFGNHDYHYMPGYTGVGYSGYQHGLAYQFRDAISQNLEHLQMAYLFDDVLCSHAGVGMEWVERHFKDTKITDLESVSTLVNEINDYFKYKPGIFEFDGFNPYGDSTSQTPIWIRPASLMQVNKGTTLKETVRQVVGHTHVKSIPDMLKSVAQNAGNRYFMIDALDKSAGYLICQDGEMIAGKVLPF